MYFCTLIRDRLPRFSSIASLCSGVIFVPFFTTKQDGTGIGLSLSRQIMRMHNGSLTLARSNEKETVFTLAFGNETIKEGKTKVTVSNHNVDFSLYFGSSLEKNLY